MVSLFLSLEKSSVLIALLRSFHIYNYVFLEIERSHAFVYVHVILVQVLNPHLSAGRQIGKSVVTE